MKNLLSRILTYVLILITFNSCQVMKEQEAQLFISSFADSAEHGLKIFSLETDPLRLGTIYTLETHPVPSYFETHPSKKFLYMLSSDPLSGEVKGGSVYAYRIDGKDEKLEYINSVSSIGEGPCHIYFDNTGRFAFVVNYQSGSFAVYPVNEDGSVGDSIRFIQFSGSSIYPGRQEAPHAHSSLLSPDNKTLYVADLGTDRIMVYDFDPSTGKLEAALNPWISSAAGSGPRHMAFHPKLDVLYVVEELSSSVGVYNTGNIKETPAAPMQRISTLPADFVETNTTAGIRVSANGKYVYISNRGHNSIAIFKTDPLNGNLTQAGHQSTLGIRPRNFCLSSDENFLLAANRNTNNIVVFRRDPGSGMLEETGIEMSIADPKCLKQF